nr:hypothetical protein [Agrobacterium vitis]
MIDAKTGISGAGRGGGDSKFGYAESNENLIPYGLLKHVHMPEIASTIERLSGGSAKGLVFTPHLTRWRAVFSSPSTDGAKPPRSNASTRPGSSMPAGLSCA